MSLARDAEALLAHALSMPGAWEDHPWGERVAKVGPKVFLFFGKDSARGEKLSFAVKLPESGVAALDRPECEPTGYGMGKHGWVTATYERGDAPPIELIRAWIEESYRAIAPKKLLGGAAAPAPAKKKRATSAKPATTAKRAPAVRKKTATKPRAKPPAAKTAAPKRRAR
jgi:predicted DNA-binding protein (MmcQ/YjbR family)